MINVSQESELGSLGLSAFLENGYCGPNYDLSDFSVGFSKIGDSINVSSYDMYCNVGRGNKYYEEINSLLEEKTKKKI